MKVKSLFSPRKPIVFFDDREEKSDVVRELKKLDLILVRKRLEVGDYLVGEKFCIERKNFLDFNNSIIDGRIYDQVSSIVDCGFKPVF